MVDRSVGTDELLITHPDQEDLPPEQQQELGVMILKMQDNELEQKGFSRLEKWLSTDSRALSFYVEFTQICVCLRSMFSKTLKNEKLPMANTHK